MAWSSRWLLACADEVAVVGGGVDAFGGPVVDHVARRVGDDAGDTGGEAVLSVLYHDLAGARGQLIGVLNDFSLSCLDHVSDDGLANADVPARIDAVKLEEDSAFAGRGF